MCLFVKGQATPPWLCSPPPLPLLLPYNLFALDQKGHLDGAQSWSDEALNKGQSKNSKGTKQPPEYIQEVQDPAFLPPRLN